MKTGVDILEMFKSRETVSAIARRLSSRGFDRDIRVMHVCGTHENAIARFGIRELLPEGLTVIAGPGCPVCVCPVQDIMAAGEIAIERGAILVTFGDMLKVPTPYGSLMDARARGGDIRIAYSPFDAVEIAMDNLQNEVVFFAVGFETTACGVASLFFGELPDNLYFLISHRLIPPALDFLLGTGEIEIDGIILPGHVSTVIGLVDYLPVVARYSMPAVAAGFEPVDIILGLDALIDQIVEGECVCENRYTRAIKDEGNPLAKKAMRDAFEVYDAYWRGIGLIPDSGLRLKEAFASRDARHRYGIPFDKDLDDINHRCSCHKVMLGKIEPVECPLFSKSCTPENPQGPCMVSFEGTCKTWYRYKRV